MKVVLGITGSVAAVLTQKLVAALLAAGHEVKLVATDRSLYFLKIPPFDPERNILLVGDQEIDVYLDKYEWFPGGYHKDDPVRHIEFRDWADALLIAPLSADTLADIAVGKASKFLTSIARAWKKDKPFLIAPAMNTEMWEDPITMEQVLLIKQRFNCLIMIDPISKMLACGDTGMGAMAKIESIIEAVKIADGLIKMKE